MDDFKKIILPLVGVMLFIAVVGFLTTKNQGKFVFPLKPKTSFPSYEIKEITVGATQVKAKIADTEAKRKTGLSETQKLGDDEGMLFVFDKKDIKPSFWMKNMQMAIDIIWIKDGKVSQIEKNIQSPKPNTKDDELKLYEPVSPIDYVLEVKAGFCDEHKLKTGDEVKIPLP